MTKPGRSKRGRGEGSIYQRKDGRWVASVSLGVDATGRRRRKVIERGTKGEVQAELARLHSQAMTGAILEPSRVMLGAFMDDWIDKSVRTRVRENTLASYRTTLRVHILPSIGHLRLAQLRPSHIQALYGELTARGVSGRTQENVHLVLSLALGVAMRWGLLQNNPAKLVDRPKRERPEMHAWTREQAARFLDVARGNRFWPLYLLAITTGMRQGELFGLKWADLDLERGQVWVQRTLVEVAGVITEGPPKTKTGERRIELPAVAVQALREHAAWMKAEGLQGADYVFTDTEGGPLRKSNLRRRSYYPMVAKAKVPRITFQSMRHTCATLLLTDGVHPKVVQERLGHADVGVTLGVYSHVLPSLQREAAERLDQMFAKPDPSQSLAKPVAPIGRRRTPRPGRGRKARRNRDPVDALDAGGEP